MVHLPDDLYSSLKATLSKEPSSATLEDHLPVIRDTILKLLHGLKRKQSELRERLEDTHNRQQVLQQKQDPKNLSPLRTHQLSSTEQSTILPLPTPTSSTESPHHPYHHNGKSLLDQSIPPQSPISVKKEHFSQEESKEDNRDKDIDGENIKDNDIDEFDINDPSTKDALDALNLQENLARRSSVRRTSMLSHFPLGINDIPPPSSIPNSKSNNNDDYKRNETAGRNKHASN
jgi:hypothetical protein